MQLVRTLANADAKQIKKQAKPLQGTVITNNEFPFPVNISKRTLQEWTNQPYKFYHEKNLMLLDIKNVFAKAKYWEQQITTKVFHTSYNRTFSR